MTEVVKVEGLKEIKSALRQLPDATAKNVLRRVGRLALEPVAEAMRQSAPVDSGALKKSITVGSRLSRAQRAQHRRTGDDIEIFAGPRNFPSATMQEFGTKNQGEQPFVRPAWDAHRHSVLDSVGKQLWAEIRKATARLARKSAKGG